MPDNPFAALSLIVAPAILTNASSLLAMSTSNRLARAVDRARDLVRELEGASPGDEGNRRFRELTVTEERTVLLARALRSFYSAMGAFASATLVSLVGAVAASAAGGLVVRAFEGAAIATGVVAVGALVHGSMLLRRETGLVVDVLRERTDRLRRGRGDPPA